MRQLQGVSEARSRASTTEGAWSAELFNLNTSADAGEDVGIPATGSLTGNTGPTEKEPQRIPQEERASEAVSEENPGQTAGDTSEGVRSILALRRN